MTGRPLCLIGLLLMVVIAGIRLWDTDLDDKIYTGEQKRLTAQVDSIQGQGEKRVLILRDVTQNGEVFCEKIRVDVCWQNCDFDEIRIGNLVSIEGRIYSFSRPGNPGQYDEYRENRDVGIAYRFTADHIEIKQRSCHYFKQTMAQIRSAYFEQFARCLPEEEAGVISAMVLGEKSGLSKDIKKVYQDAGVSHILAISGLHISLIGAGLFYFLRRFLMPMKAAALISAAILLMYGELVGFPVATQRAIVMMLCVLGARFLGKHYDLYCSLALSAIIQLGLHPMELFHAGFLMSYGTVLGIHQMVRPLQEEAAHPISQSVLGCVGIQLITLPMSVWFYYEWNPYSFIANLLILPLMCVMIGMSFLGGTISFFLPVFGKFLFGIVHLILEWERWVCSCIHGFPGADFIVGCPMPIQIVLYYIILEVVIAAARMRPDFFREKKERFWCIQTAAVLFGMIILFFRMPVSGIQITNLDVGQGDGACVQTQNAAILIDGGSSDVERVGEYRISRYLKYQGVKKLDSVFVTHSDSDHLSGIREIIEDPEHFGLQIGRVVLPGVDKTDEAYNDFVDCCLEHGVPVEYMIRGQKIRIGDIECECLHPDSQYDWKTENDYSLILLLSFGKFRGLFTGDLEQTGEREIKTEPVDYLKIPHHGSKGSSTEEFLNMLSPAVSVISAGKNNRYGHPAKETIERLNQIQTRVFCTIDCGAVTIRTDGDGVLSVRTYKT